MTDWVSIRAWLRAEFLALTRDRATFAGYIILALMTGLAPLFMASPWVQDALDPQAEEAPESWSDACEDSSLATVRFEPPPPPWLDWPGPIVEEKTSDADVSIALGNNQIHVAPLHDNARSRQVAACLRHLRDMEWQSRLDSAGVQEGKIRLRRGIVGQQATGPGFDVHNSARLFAVVLALIGIYAELFPRLRGSGFLETLASLPGDRGWLAAASILHGIGVSIGVLGVVGVVGVLGSLATGTPIPTWWSALPVVVATPVLASVLTLAYIDVGDVRAAAFRSIPITMSLGAAAIARVVDGFAPGWGCAVPVFGPIAAAVGWAENTPVLLVTSAAITVGVSLVLTVRRLERMDVTSSISSQTLNRRARGHYGREVLVLFMIGVGGTTTWMPARAINDLVSLTIATQILFFVIPAFAALRWLNLDIRKTMSLRVPHWRGFLAAPIVACGTIPLGLVLGHVGIELLGVTQADLAAYQAGLPDIDTKAGVLTISLLPGVCEELLFRGAIFGLLLKSGRVRRALVLQAVLFGLMHILGFKLLPTGILGLVMGLVVLRTGSLIPAMIAHLLHNGSAAMMPAGLADPWVADSQAMAITAAVGLVFLAIAWFVAGPSGQKVSGTPNPPGRTAS